MIKISRVTHWRQAPLCVRAGGAAAALALRPTQRVRNAGLARRSERKKAGCRASSSVLKILTTLGLNNFFKSKQTILRLTSPRKGRPAARARATARRRTWRRCSRWALIVEKSEASLPGRSRCSSAKRGRRRRALRGSSSRSACRPTNDLRQCRDLPASAERLAKGGRESRKNRERDEKKPQTPPEVTAAVGVGGT